MNETRPCHNKEQPEVFLLGHEKCLGTATETRRIKPWPIDGRRFKNIYLCSNCAMRFDDSRSEAWGEALGS